MNKYKVIFTNGYSIEVTAINESEARYKASSYSSQPIQSVYII